MKKESLPDLPELHKKILQVISKFRIESPIPSKAIAPLVGLPFQNYGTQGSEIRHIVNELRQQGFAICARDDGYYYAQTPQQLSEYLKHAEDRLETQAKALRGLRRSGKKQVAKKFDFYPRLPEEEQGELF